MKRVQPGALRIRIKAKNDGAALADEGKIEVQQTDGTWIPLCYVVKAAISLKPNAHATADLRVLIEELCVDANASSVTRRTVKNAFRKSKRAKGKRV